MICSKKDSINDVIESQLEYSELVVSACRRGHLETWITQVCKLNNISTMVVYDHYRDAFGSALSDIKDFCSIAYYPHEEQPDVIQHLKQVHPNRDFMDDTIVVLLDLPTVWQPGMDQFKLELNRRRVNTYLEMNKLVRSRFDLGSRWRGKIVVGLVFDEGPMLWTSVAESLCAKLGHNMKYTHVCPAVQPMHAKTQTYLHQIPDQPSGEELLWLMLNIATSYHQLTMAFPPEYPGHYFSEYCHSLGLTASHFVHLLGCLVWVQTLSIAEQQHIVRGYDNSTLLNKLEAGCGGVSIGDEILDETNDRYSLDQWPGYHHFVYRRSHFNNYTSVDRRSPCRCRHCGGIYGTRSCLDVPSRNVKCPVCNKWAN